MTQKIRHGFVRADGLRFWGYASGREYWVTPSTYVRFTKRLLEAKRKRYRENPEKYRKLQREYRASQTPEQIERTRELDRHRRRTPKRQRWLRKWRRKHMRENASFAISMRLRVRIANALARVHASKECSTAELLGCSWGFFLQHLEKQFLPGMTWENRKLWHIDHIRPCAAFDLTRPEEQRRCFHYSNLRPLWAKDNLVKNGKY